MTQESSSSSSLQDMAFPPLQNNYLLKVARGEPVEKVPVWIMRQAGRYLPGKFIHFIHFNSLLFNPNHHPPTPLQNLKEFRKTRSTTTFFELCRNESLACEVTLQPIDRYTPLLDASIIFSDILVIPQAMGLQVDMVEGKGPVFASPLKTPEDLNRLTYPVNVEKELSYVYKAIQTTRVALNGRVPLFGFAGAPWTIMAYMIEGGGSKTLSKAKSWLFKYPESSHELLDKITKTTIEYLAKQVERGGAQILQVFDSWAGELSIHHYMEFGFPYLQKIATELKSRFPDIPLVVFAKGANHAVEAFARDTAYDVIGVDWTVDLKYVSEIVIKKYGKALQGNMDPSVLYGDDETIRREAKKMFTEIGWRKEGGMNKGWVANLGHGMYPDHDPEKLRVFLEAIRDYSREFGGSSGSN